MTRYFKSPNGRMVCSTSSGNRSKRIPGRPADGWDWIEINQSEFIALRKKIRGIGHPRRKTKSELMLLMKADEATRKLMNMITKTKTEGEG